MPKSRVGYWKAKLQGNKRRDRENQRRLLRMGWKCLTIWECEVQFEKQITSRIRRFLRQGEPDASDAPSQKPYSAFKILMTFASNCVPGGN